MDHAPIAGETTSIRSLLIGGDRRSIGESDRLALIIVENADLFASAVEAMSDENPIVRMRAADAVEKASRLDPERLTGHQARLLGPIAQNEQPEVRWHLLQMLPRLDLSSSETQAAFDLAVTSAASESRIVAAEALSALFALSQAMADLRIKAVTAARAALGSPSPAVRARARRHLREAKSQG